MDMFTPLVEIINAVGVPGVLGWYLWYDTAVARPKRQEAESLQIQNLAQHYNAMTERIAKDFTDTIREERGIRVRELQIFRDEMRSALGLSDSVHRFTEKSNRDNPLADNKKNRETGE